MLSSSQLIESNWIGDIASQLCNVVHALIPVSSVGSCIGEPKPADARTQAIIDDFVSSTSFLRNQCTEKVGIFRWVQTEFSSSSNAHFSFRKRKSGLGTRLTTPLMYSQLASYIALLWSKNTWQLSPQILVIARRSVNLYQILSFI